MLAVQRSLILMLITVFSAKGFVVHTFPKMKGFHYIKSNNFARLTKEESFKSRIMNLWGRGFLVTDKEKEEVDPGDVKGTSFKILKYPHPLLREENAKVTAFDDSLKKLADEMLLVMYASNGIGLAAPQVGVNKQVMVFNEAGDPDKKTTETVLVNPIIIDKSVETDLEEEGCLSFPQINGKVFRSTWIQVQYQDHITGQVSEKKFSGLPARIFQHEFDHLDKVLFIDRMVSDDRVKVNKRLDKYVKKYGPGGKP